MGPEKRAKHLIVFYKHYRDSIITNLIKRIEGIECIKSNVLKKKKNIFSISDQNELDIECECRK